MGLNPGGIRNSHTSCPGLWTLTVCQSCTGTSWDTAETWRPGPHREKLLRPWKAGSRDEKEGQAGGQQPPGRDKGTGAPCRNAWAISQRPGGQARMSELDMRGSFVSEGMTLKSTCME